MRRLQILFVLVLLPIFVCGITFQWIGQRMLDGQMMQTLSQHLQFKMNEMEAQMRNAKSEMLSLVTDAKTMKLAGAPSLFSEYARSMAINDLQRAIMNTWRANPFIRRIELFLPKLNKTMIASNGSGTIRDLESYQLLYLMSEEKRVGTSTLLKDSKLYSIVQEPIFILVGSGSPPRTLAYIEYDLDAIQELLGGVLPNSRPAYLLLSQTGEVMLTNESDGKTVSDMAAWVMAKPFAGSALQKAQAGFLFEGIETVGKRDFFIIVKDSDALNYRCVFFVSREEAFSNVLMFWRAMIALVILFMSAIVLYGIYSYHNIHLPIRQLVGAFDRLSRGEMDFQVNNTSRSEFGYLAGCLNDTLIKLKNSVEQLVRQKTLTQRAQLKQLQAQINPHFLYNSFYLLSGMLQLEDLEGARKLSDLLGRYFQYIVRDARDDVPLSEEIEHARAYTELQRMRFGRRLHLHFSDTPPDFPNPAVPRLILQPILENAFVHAIEKTESPGILDVSFETEDTYIVIRVENDGVFDAPELARQLAAQFEKGGDQGEITGLINVDIRLKLTQGIGLTADAPSSERVRITVRIRKGDS